MKKLFAFLFVALLFVGVQDVWAETINACANKNNGNTRLLFPISNSEECRNSETAVSWSANGNGGGNGGSGLVVVDASDQVVADVDRVLNPFNVLISMTINDVEYVFTPSAFGFSFSQGIYYFESNDCTGEPHLRVNAFKPFFPETFRGPIDFATSTTEDAGYTPDYDSRIDDFTVNSRTQCPVALGAFCCLTNSFMLDVAPITFVLDKTDFPPPFRLEPK